MTAMPPADLIDRGPWPVPGRERPRGALPGWHGTTPFSVSDDEEVDELRVLMAAGLIAGLSLKVPRTPCGGRERQHGLAMARVIRILAITPDGRRLLRRSDTGVGDGVDVDQGSGEHRATSH